MTTDVQLLRDYAEAKSQDAFSELVRRHLDLVYCAALRQVRSPQLAEEVAQSVFTDLSRAADKLGPDTILTAWLYQVTRRTAIDVVRRDSRRQARERLAVEMAAMNTATDWNSIEPLLDDAMEALEETDRTAILLRYFENKSLREVGQSLGTSDDAAQKRVSRAVDRLREFFSERGVAVGAGGLVVLLSANAVHAAPPALTASIITALTGSIIHGSTSLAASKVIAMTLLQKTLVTATIAVVAGASIYEAHQTTKARAELNSLQQQQAPLAAQIQQLQQQRDEASNEVVSLTEEVARAGHNEMELLKLRGEVGVLRQQLSQSAATMQPRTTSQPADENPMPTNLPVQIAAAIAQGDPTALQRLTDYSKSQHEFFNTNHVGLTNEQSAELSEKAFGGLWAAFDFLTAEALKGNPNARRAIDQGVRVSYLAGTSARALGTLAANGDEPALQSLLNYDKNGILLSSAVGALSGPAGNGNDQAIAFLASVLKDDSDKPLWFMASNGLQKAASSGNQVAIEAIRFRSQ